MKLETRWAFSPIFVSSVATGFSILATFFPVQSYSSLVSERSAMFLSVPVLALIVLCWVGFVFGAGVSADVLGRGRPNHCTPHNVVDFGFKSSTSVVLISATLLSFFLAAFLIWSVGYHELAAALSGKGGGNQLRTELAERLSSAKLGWIPIFVGALVWTGYSRILSLPTKSPALIVLFGLSFLAALVACTLTLARTPVVILLLATFACSIMRDQQRHGLSFAKLVFVMLVGALFLLVSFALFEYIRHGSGTTDAIYSILANFVGYVVAPYNRLAALLAGDLRLPFSGEGNYTFRWLIDGLYYAQLYDNVRDVLGVEWIRPGLENWHNQFQAVGNAGLNESYIWTTVFGEVYADFGWASPLIFAVYGALSQCSYVLFRRASTLGIVIFPYILYTLLMWPAGFYVANRNILLLGLVVLVVKGLETSCVVQLRWQFPIFKRTI